MNRLDDIYGSRPTSSYRPCWSYCSFDFIYYNIVIDFKFKCNANTEKRHVRQHRSHFPARESKYVYVNIHCQYVSKTYHSIFVHNFDRCEPIFKILSLSESAGNLQHSHCHISHLTLNVFLHYLSKFKCSYYHFRLQRPQTYCIEIWIFYLNS